MKNLRKLSRAKLKVISGGMVSCGGKCSDGSGVSLDSCTSCINYPNGAACYNSHDKSIHVEKCLELPFV